MSEEQEQRNLENSEMVHRIIEKLWDNMQEETKSYTDARRYIIFSRVTAFLVANVYMPVVEKAAKETIETVEGLDTIK